MNTLDSAMNGAPLKVEHPRDFFARAEVLSGTYFNITEKEYCESLRISNINIEGLSDEDKYLLNGKSTESKIKAIVFAAMCVEAAINDYAGSQLGDKYYQQHLVNLDVVSKWVVIPRLICGNSLDKSGPAFASLKKLIKARNNLIHNKSFEMDASDPIALVNKLDKRELEFEDDFTNSLRTLYLLSMEISYVVGNYHNPIRIFNDKTNPFQEVPSLAKPLFTACQKTVSEIHNKAIKPN